MTRILYPVGKSFYKLNWNLKKFFSRKKNCLCYAMNLLERSLYNVDVPISEN